MPIVVGEQSRQDPLFAQLEREGALLVGEEEARTQNIRAARIGILNLMPATAMEATEAHWLRYMSNTVLQIVPVLVKFDDDQREREGASRRAILSRYKAFSRVVEEGLDGLIITGDNLELDERYEERRLMDFSDVTHAKKLDQVIDWARGNVASTMYSCWSAHYTMNRLYGLQRRLAPKKVFGVYGHDVTEGSSLTKGMDDVVNAPHSRHGDISVTDVDGNDDLQLLAANGDIGWLLVEGENQCGGTDLFIQGHPEYGRRDLHREYDRDKYRGQPVPYGYYPGNDPNQRPVKSWANDAKTLHANWIEQRIYPSIAKNG